MLSPFDRILLVGHGSPHAAGNAEYMQFAETLETRLGVTVQPCFLELAEPSIMDGIRLCAEAGTEHIAVLPLFLGPAGHQKNDVPAILAHARQIYPNLSLRYGTPIGAHYCLVRILAQRASEALASRPASIPPHETALLLAVRGSSDPDSNAEVYKLARMLSEGRDYLTVEVAFQKVALPTITQGITRCVRLGARRIVVLPYLLFTGFVRHDIEQQARAAQGDYPTVEIVVGEHLFPHPELIEAVAQRYQELVDGTATMTCDLCKYRHRMTGFEHDYGKPQMTHVHAHEHGHAHHEHEHPAHHAHEHGRAHHEYPTHHAHPAHHAHEHKHEHEHPAYHEHEHGHAHHEHEHGHARMTSPTPESIAAESFVIIRRHLAEQGYHFDPPTLAVVERIIHSTADFEFADLVRCSPNAIAAGVHALQGGGAVITDVQMVRIGINAARLSAFGGSLHCLIDDAEIRTQAMATGTTRSTQSMRHAAERGLLTGSIVAIGNAPTALEEIIRLVAQGVRPALVIGVPVGFVGAAESKAALMQVVQVPWIVTTGRKGGSTVAVAIVNALLRLAGGAGNADL